MNGLTPVAILERTYLHNYLINFKIVLNFR